MTITSNPACAAACEPHDIAEAEGCLAEYLEVLGGQRYPTLSDLWWALDMARRMHTALEELYDNA